MRVFRTNSGIEVHLYKSDKEAVEENHSLFARFPSGPGLFLQIVSDKIKDRGGQNGFSIDAVPSEPPHEKRSYYVVLLQKDKWASLVSPPYGLEANHFGTRTVFDRIDLMYWNMESNFPERRIGE